MGSPFSFANMFKEPDEKDDPAYGGNPYTRNHAALPSSYDSVWAEGDIGKDAGDLLPPIDQEDPSAKMYLERASQPLPSEGLLKDYLARRPEESQYKSNIWQKIGAALLGAGGQQGAARNLVHPGFEHAYGDWQTEGKLIPQIARGADLGRQKELEAARFNIIGTAKKKQFEETQLKNKQLEENRQRDDAAKEAAAKEKARRDEAEAIRKSKTDQRLEDAAKRAEDSAKRSSEREIRLDEADKRRTKQEEIKTKEHTYKQELEGLDESVKDEIVNNPHWKDMFTRTKEGMIDLSEEGKSSGMKDLIDFTIKQRKKILQKKYGIGG